MKKLLLTPLLLLLLLLSPSIAEAKRDKVPAWLKEKRAKFMKDVRKTNNVGREITSLIASNVSGETRNAIEADLACFANIIPSAYPLDEIYAVDDLQYASAFSQIIKDVDSVTLGNLLKKGQKLPRFSRWWRNQGYILKKYNKTDPFLACPALEQWSAERFLGINDITDEIYGYEVVSSLLHKTENWQFYSSIHLNSQVNKMQWNKLPRGVERMFLGLGGATLEDHFYFIPSSINKVIEQTMDETGW